jgi:hypothetical protein
VIPRPVLRPRTPARALLAALLAGPLLLAACGSAGATFSPDGPCVVDGRAAGAYPALEALVPATFDGVVATTRDSGRDCSRTALGTFAVAHDLAEVRFAGATWDEGGGLGTSIAVLALPAGDLPVAWAEQFYEEGAKAAKRTERIETSRPILDGPGEVFRLDTLNELSFQSVVVWADGPVARVVIVATRVSPDTSRAEHDARVLAAVAAAWAAQLAAPAATTAPAGS